MPSLLAATRWLRHGANSVVVGLLATMFVSFILQIFFRYVVDLPLGWSEEVIVTAWLWTVLWGAAFVINESEEIRFDILYSNGSERFKRISTIITGLTLIVVYGVSLPASYGYVAFMKVEHSAYLHIPINWLYSVYVLFAVASIVRYSFLVWRAIKGAASPATNPSELSD
ncbi:MAG: TRAP transporter small permease subunit [Pseudolabrys sp.]|jgi:TRAP-type C4-dicarboxylate transport system permease small subunit